MRVGEAEDGAGVGFAEGSGVETADVDKVAAAGNKGGFVEGEGVGTAEDGSSVVARVGLAEVGSGDGKTDGSGVGCAEGSGVGIVDGDRVGSADDKGVNVVGLAVGWLIGDSDGAGVGLADGCAVVG